MGRYMLLPIYKPTHGKWQVLSQHHNRCAHADSSVLFKGQRIELCTIPCMLIQTVCRVGTQTQNPRFCRLCEVQKTTRFCEIQTRYQISINLKIIKKVLLDAIDREFLEIANTIVTWDGTSSHCLESQIYKLEELLDRYNATVAVLKDASKWNKWLAS